MRIGGRGTDRAAADRAAGRDVEQHYTFYPQNLAQAVRYFRRSLVDWSAAEQRLLAQGWGSIQAIEAGQYVRYLHGVTTP